MPFFNAKIRFVGSFIVVCDQDPLPSFSHHQLLPLPDLQLFDDLNGNGQAITAGFFENLADALVFQLSPHFLYIIFCNALAPGTCISMFRSPGKDRLHSNTQVLGTFKGTFKGTLNFLSHDPKFCRRDQSDPGDAHHDPGRQGPNVHQHQHASSYCQGQSEKKLGHAYFFWIHNFIDYTSEILA